MWTTEYFTRRCVYKVTSLSTQISTQKGIFQHRKAVQVKRLHSEKVATVLKIIY